MPDMREILEIAKEDAPPTRLGVDDIVAAGRRRRRWAVAQRAGGAVAVLALAAVTATVLVVTHGTPDRSADANRVGSPPKTALPPPAPVAAPLFTYTFGGFTSGRYRVVEPLEVTRAYQVATVLGPAKDGDGKDITAAVGSLTVYQPGVYDPAKVRGGQKLTVQGRDAYHAVLQRDLPTGYFINGVPTDVRSIPVDTLAWQWAENAWAVVDNDAFFQDRQFPVEDMIALTGQLRFDREVPARLPFRPGYLPAGWTLQSVSGRSFAAEDSGTVQAVYSAPESSFESMTGPRNFFGYAGSPSVVVAISQEDTPPPDAPKKKDICLAGDHWCTWSLPGTGYYIAVHDPSKTLSDADLLRIGQSLTFSDFNQPATWPTVV